MPAEDSDFSCIQLMLSHIFQYSSKQFPIEAKIDVFNNKIKNKFCIIKIE